MSDKEARDWVRANAKACPCCGAALLIQVDGDERALAHMRGLAEVGARMTLVPVEDAEREIAAQDYKPVRPIGGRAP